MTPYKYESLDLSKETIRVLRLHRSPFFDNDICIELIQTTLGQVPFEALSYTWGTTEKPCNILLDGYQIPVTRNLHSALQYLRSRHEDRFLWIDAICINQDDHEEREQQVGQMKSIYEHAEKVLIWMGVSDPDIDEFFSAILPLRDLIMARARASLGGDDRSASESLLPGFLELRHCTVLKRIMQNGWFRRIWILQEVANARTASVIYGHNQMSTRLFTRLPLVLGISPSGGTQAVLDIMPGHSRSKSWWAERRDLRTLLSKFSGSQATDPRDEVYALLGLCSDQEYASIFIKPDYTRSQEQVAQDVGAYQHCLDLELPGLGILSKFSASTDRTVRRDDMFEWILQEYRLVTKSIDSAASSGQFESPRDELETLVQHLFHPRNREHIDTTPNICCLAEDPAYSDLFQKILDNDDVDFNIPNRTGDTVMHRAVTCWPDDQIQKLLLRKDVKLDTRNEYGFTPMLLAFMLERMSIAEELVGRVGNDIDLSTKVQAFYGCYVTGNFRKVCQISSSWSRASFTLVEESLLERSLTIEFPLLSDYDYRKTIWSLRGIHITRAYQDFSKELVWVMDFSQPGMKQFVKSQALAALRSSGVRLEWSAETEESILDIVVASGTLWKVKFVLDLGCRKGHTFQVQKSLLRTVRARQVDVARLLLSYAVSNGQWECSPLEGGRRVALSLAAVLQDREMMELLTKDQDQQGQAHGENYTITPQETATMKFLAAPNKWTRITEDFANGK